MAGFKCVKLDGRMNIHAKNISIQQFHDDPDTCVFLISLKAGGMALNLTIASHCFLVWFFFPSSFYYYSLLHYFLPFEKDGPMVEPSSRVPGY